MADTLKEVYIENKLEYAKYTLDPKVEGLFPEITKDMALSHLDFWALKRLTLIMEVIDILILYKLWFPMSLNSFLRDVYSVLQLNRSKLGFEAKNQRANFTGEISTGQNIDSKKDQIVFQEPNRR